MNNIEYGIKTKLFPGGPDIVVTYTRDRRKTIVLQSVLQNGRADRCLLEELTTDKILSFKKQCADDWRRSDAKQPCLS